MRIILKSIYIIIALLLVACQQTPKNYGKQFLPPNGQELFFTHQYCYPDYSNQALPQPFGMAFYTNLNQDVDVTLVKDVTIRHLYVLLDSLDAIVPLVLMRVSNRQFSEMTHGKHDDDIEQFAGTLKSFGAPVYLAPGFEVNHPMYKLDPETYVKGYRYFVEKLDSLEITNVSYVWHVIGMQPRWEEPITLEECYPGDEYVNWLGLTVHNISPHHYPEDGFFEASIYDEVAAFADAHDLPMMICESSTRSVDKNFDLRGDSLWGDWYEPFFEMIKQYDIRAFSHIFYSYDDKVILNRWREKIAQPNFIHAQENPANILQGK